MVSLGDIKNFLRGKILLDEPLAKHTWMKVGGAADYYIEPADRKDLTDIVNYFQQNGFPFYVFGRGSNVIVSDDGIRGAVMNLEQSLTGLRTEGNVVVAEAGVWLQKFVDFCVQRELGGVEMLAGIPGTIGGAVVMNAGAKGGEIADRLVEVEVLRNGVCVRVPRSEGGFTYRHSIFEGEVVLSATFEMPREEKTKLANRRREVILDRNRTQPLDLPNSGSMFKNPPNAFAARLIDQAGLKGKRVGNAQISEKHANFIVNLGEAKAVDIIQLLELAQRTVYQNSGITLELEVKLFGFPFKTLGQAA